LDTAWDHRHIPFELLLRKAALPRGMARPPLIQVLFEYRVETAGAVPAVPGLQLQHAELPPADTALDLHLVVTRRASGLALSLRCNRSLLDREGAARLLANYRTLLEDALARPDAAVGELALLSPEERRRVLHELNRTDAPYPSRSPLHELVREQARRTPAAPAYHFEGATASYQQVEEWSEAVAHRLMTRGVGRGDYVPLLMDRSLELPVAMLGVMKTGAAFVPMDIHWPAERIADIVTDAGPPVVLVRDADTAGALLPRGTAWDRVAVDELAPAPAPAEGDAGPDDPIYMIYTSGSTGKPKGAINRHRGIVNRLSYMTRRYGFGREDVVLQTSAHIFDASIWQYFWPLINGGPAVLPSPMVGFDYDHVTRLIERYRVTVTDFVPSVFNLLVDLLDRDPVMAGRLASLRQVLIGGEALSPGPAFRFREHLPRVGITNTYGPTETSIGVIFHEVGDRYEDPLPIGRPIDNVHTYILDDFRQLVPIGVTGMLHVGGECVGLGYHRSPAKTREAFLDNPFPEVHRGRIYRTGDLARYRVDGTIDFLGRSDHQVKIRGLRIELGEIESKLAEHPGIRAAVVAPWDGAGGRRLAAYFVAQPGTAPTATELRAFLKQSLPEYVLPHAFMALAELPLLRSGKVDRKALPEPQEAAAAEERRGPLPATATEQLIAEVWQAELGLAEVSVRDNFFELGGDSLGVVKVAAELEYRSGLRVDAEQMMIQDLGQLAAAVAGESPEDSARAAAAPERPDIAPFFIGAPQGQLYACLHPAGPSPRAAVLCPALGHEYLFTHRALRSLAERLARAGLPALRFDYPGTGDSAGEPGDLSLEHCVDSVTRAVAALRDRHPAEEVLLVGLRLGATLAARAAERIEGVAGLVLWDPVVDGSAYLEEVAALHRRWLGGRAPLFRSEPGGTETADLVGMPVTRALHDEIRAVGTEAFGALAGRPSLVIDSRPGGGPAPLTEAAAELGWPLACRHLPYPEIWNQDPYKTQ
ncbi:MAG TPA: amino acid adenylation domain-containing protein, partial [Gammaproteobacteria bacterium]|nr:amino acid adenylation domain-containing protein [Gammaproteobacteria bacterium]